MTGAHDKPLAEVEIDDVLVRALLQAQHPDLADLPLRPLGSGWDNALWRVGDDLVARLPRRAQAAPLVAHELRWLPQLAPSLPLPIPVPVRAGAPGGGYPWAWSVVPWFPGERAMDARIDDPRQAADQLGRFVAALHQPAPPDAPRNPYRGIPLADRDHLTHGWIDQLAATIDADALRAAWAAHVAVARWTGPACWLHGDLHPNNLIVHQGSIAAVVDFGDITSGDPATDVALAWTLLPSDARATFRAAAGAVDDDTWHRGRGWALALGLAYLAHSADDPSFEVLGRRTLTAVLDDPDQP